MLDSLAHIAKSLSHPPALSLWLAAAAVLTLLRWRRTGVFLAALALLWTVTWSIPVVSDGLRMPLESRYARLAATALQPADAIVVLGGGRHYGWLEQPQVDPYKLESSRLAGGARAWLAGRAPYIVLSGGSEVPRMQHAIGRLGIPARALIPETRSRNTEENALCTAQIARVRGFERVIVTTSALHMPRAMLHFRMAGLDAVAMPVPEKAHRRSWRERWLPSRTALRRSSRAFKEYLGIAAAWAAIHASPRRNCPSGAETAVPVAYPVTQAASTCCVHPRRARWSPANPRPAPPAGPASAAATTVSRTSLKRGPS